MTRVAVAQLEGPPAIVTNRRSPLEHPIFGSDADSVAIAFADAGPATSGEARQLRERVRKAYCRQLSSKVLGILAACRSWNVRLVVFPEYSIPWDVLRDVAHASNDLVVVAGTHTVEREGLRSKLYADLGCSEDELPSAGQAVCPVLLDGRLLGLQAKLSRSQWERDLKLGTKWRPIELPRHLPGPLGLLVCLDFLFREGDAHRDIVAAQLEACRFLAVPSLTPMATNSEFGSKGWEEARRYGRPVLYADGASGGGSTIFVDEGAPTDLRRFPEHVGFLEAGDEGVIVADIDLGHRRAGPSRRYAVGEVVRPFAVASLLYRGTRLADNYASWQQAAMQLLDYGDRGLEEFIARVHAQRSELGLAASLRGCEARGRRLRRLVSECDQIYSVTEAAAFVREVVLDPSVLPPRLLSSALANGCAEAIRAWPDDARTRDAAGLEAELRRRATEHLRDAMSDLGEAAQATVRATVAEVRGSARDETSTQLIAPLVVPEVEDPVTLRDVTIGTLHFEFRRRPNEFVTTVGARPRDISAAEFQKLDDDGKPWFDGDLHRVREPWLLAQAEGLTKVGLAGVTLTTSAAGANPRSSVRALFVVGLDKGKWIARICVSMAETFHREEVLVHRSSQLIELSPADQQTILKGFRHCGLRFEKLERARAMAESDIADCLSLLQGTRTAVERFLELRLRDVGNTFVDPRVRIDGEESDRRGTEALDQWRDGDRPVLLLLGKFGSGKSTLLAHWCASMHQRHSDRLAFLCPLGSASVTADPLELLLTAAGLPNTARERAALTLLLDNDRAVACFDGFDEMATRVSASELEQRLTQLVAPGELGVVGKVVVSARDHYFSTGEDLARATAVSLQGIGGAQRAMRMLVQPFGEHEIRQLVEGQRPEPGAAQAALARIAATYDLGDLVRTPLLLGIVLLTLDRLDASQRVGPAEIYEAYLARWLEQTPVGSEVFTPRQKEVFAEALAAELWRHGDASCHWRSLHRSVRRELARELPEQFRFTDAFFEIQGGSFFVREGEDQYRFAHKSFLEFFLARWLVRQVPNAPRELATAPLTREVLDFVHALLLRQGRVAEQPMIVAVQGWLAGGRSSEDRKAQGSEDALAAANAVRLLVGIARREQQPAGWLPAGANLKGVVLDGEDLTGARLEEADLTEASLVGADLTDARLVRARLVRANLASSKLDAADCSGADLTGARLVQATGHKANFSDTICKGLQLEGSTWTACTWPERVRGPSWPGANSFLLLPDHPGHQLAPMLGLIRGHRGEVLTAVFAPDGRTVASGGDDGRVRLWEVGSGQPRLQFEAHRGRVRSVVFAPDGRTLASGGDDGRVRVWEVGSGQPRLQLEAHRGPVRSVVFSPDGSKLASGGNTGSVQLWEVSSGQPLRKFEGHRGQVRSVVFAPDGRTLASGGDDGSVRLWEVGSGQLLRHFEGHRGRIRSVVFAPDGCTLASGGDDGRVRLWEVGSGQQLRQFEGRWGQIWSVVFAPDGRTLASGGSDVSVRLWDVCNGQLLRQFEGHLGRVWSVVFAPDGRTLASGGGDGSVRMWDVSSGQALRQFEGHRGRVWSVVFAPDGRTLASGGGDGSVRMWDVSSGQALRQFEAHHGGVRSVVLALDGRTLASGGDDGRVRLWEVSSGQLLRQFEAHRGRVRSVVFAPDGRTLASGGDDGFVRLWEVGSGQPLRQFEGHRGHVRSIVFAPDGRTLASGGNDRRVRLWDAVSGQSLRPLEGHRGRIRSVVFAPDGRTLASGGGGEGDGSVRLWDVISGRQLRQFEAHGGGIRSVVFAPDGRTLASGGDDGSVRLWDVVSGQQLRQLEGRSGQIWSVVFGPDGRTLATGGDGGVVVAKVQPTSLTVVATLKATGESAVTRTRGGFYVSSGREGMELKFVLRDGKSSVFAPLGALSRALLRPDRVAAALAGDLSGDDGDAAIAAWLAAETATASTARSGGARGPQRVQTNSGPVVIASAPNTLRPGAALDGDEEPPGRAAILLELCDLVLARSPALLEGPRRAGKTSILNRLVTSLQQQGCTPRYVSLQGPKLTTIDDIAVAIEPSLSEHDEPSLALEQELARVQKPVLLLDEILSLKDSEPRAFAWLRKLGQKHAGIVYAGTHWDWVQVVERAERVPGSSFGNDVTPVRVGPLARDAAMAFLDAALQEAIPDKPLRRQIAEWTYEFSVGWPFYLQVIAWAVTQGVRTRVPTDREQLRDLYTKRLLMERDSVLRQRWNDMPAAARAILLRLREGILPGVASFPAADRKLLRDVGLVTPTGSWLDDPPFMDWVKLSAEEDR